MKTKSIRLFILLVAAAGLRAAEPTAAAKPPPAGPASLSDQAALVQQIGREAAGDFDAEAHARFLRERIEALLNKPPEVKADGQATLPARASVVEPGNSVPATSTPTGPTGKVSQPDLGELHTAALKQVVEELRALANRLEALLENGAR